MPDVERCSRAGLADVGVGQKKTGCSPVLRQYGQAASNENRRRLSAASSRHPGLLAGECVGRGTGLAGSVLHAIVAVLQGEDVNHIIINVDTRNTGAHRLYRRHGFVTHCPYYEGLGQRKNRLESDSA